MSTHNAPTSPGPAISVVMPVYNARPYLPFTLRNIIVDQFGEMKPEEWELIAVDDGSSDGSHLEIEPWIEKYPQSVKLIRKSNGGPSSARNAGLAAARGTYVYFCDSDDIILRGALPRLLALTSGSTPDLIKFYFRMISGREYAELTDNVPEADIAAADVTTLSVRDYLQKNDGMVGGSRNNVATVLTIYRRELLTKNKLTFNTALGNGEDELFLWGAILCAQTVCSVPAELYLYNQRTDSVSRPAGHRRLAQYDAERIRFVTAMQDILRQINARQLLDEKNAALVSDVYRHVYYLHLTSLIVNTRASLQTIYTAIKSYRTADGKVFPGKIKLAPYYDKHTVSFHVKLRRIITAYVIDRIVARQINHTRK